jgi:thymidylate synthase (FAD)
LDKYFPVLDHGFVALKDYMGSDEDIEQAARISYGKGTRKKTDTEKLIRYLLRHRHTSPFEMCEVKLHVRVPMDCWRQWIRHRTASVNEYSSRYSEVPFFCKKTPPNEWRLQSNDNKQGSDGYYNNDSWLCEEEKEFHTKAYELYQRRLDVGIAREQARKDLPLSTYTEAFWKIDLHNLLHFLKLRCDHHAQLEIRCYANTIAGIVRELFPITFVAWQDYSFNAVTFSAQERYLLSLYTSNYEDREQASIRAAKDMNMSDRELQEFFHKINGPAFELPILDVNEAKNYEDFYPKG